VLTHSSTHRQAGRYWRRQHDCHLSAVVKEGTQERINRTLRRTDSHRIRTVCCLPKVLGWQETIVGKE